jgi:hypothetical protein
MVLAMEMMMKFNFHGEPYDKLLTSFVSFYAGVTMLKCIYNKADIPKSAKKYIIDMKTNDTPSNGLEAIYSCIFGKKPNETIVDKYTGAKLWKAGKSFVNGRAKKIANIKSGRAGDFWESIAIMQSRFNSHSTHYQLVKKAMLVWNKLDTDEKGEAINAAYHLIMQADFDKELEMELYTINNELMMTANLDGTYSMSNYAKKFLRKLDILPLKEEGEEGADPTTQSTGSIASNQEKLFGGKLIKRRVRKFKAIKYKDPRKVKQHSNEDSETCQ